MKRVVVTGMGIVSCIGNDRASVVDALRAGHSGIAHSPEALELGLRSQVAGTPAIDLEAEIDRKFRRFMGNAAAYSYVAMRDAIADAGLEEDEVTDARTASSSTRSPAGVDVPWVLI